METSMIATDNYSFTPMERFLKVLAELKEGIQKHKTSITSNYHFYRELRGSRKEFYKMMQEIFNGFKTLPDDQQIQIERIFYKRMQKFEVAVPSVINDLGQENTFFWSWCLIREVKKTLLIIKKTQSYMTDFLYPDPTAGIEANPALYKQLADSWGDLANDDY